MQPTVEDVLTFVEDGASAPSNEQASQALEVASAMAVAYTRGAGKLPNGMWREGVGEVVLSAAARIVANPSGIQWRNQAGDFSAMRSSGFNGFTLAEQFVLNRYRKTSV